MCHPPHPLCRHTCFPANSHEKCRRACAKPRSRQRISPRGGGHHPVTRQSFLQAPSFVFVSLNSKLESNEEKEEGKHPGSRRSPLRKSWYSLTTHPPHTAHSPVSGFGLWHLRFRVWGLGFRVWVWGAEFGVWGWRCGVWCVVCGVWGVRWGVHPRFYAHHL